MGMLSWGGNVSGVITGSGTGTIYPVNSDTIVNATKLKHKLNHGNCPNR
jgi:hypothetical protein